MNTKGNVLRVNFRILTIIIVLLLLFLIFVLSLVFFRVEKNDFYSNETHEYKYRHIKPESGEVTGGLLHLYDKIEADDYLIEEDANGNILLISNLRTDEYMCTGQCYCDETADRRSGNVITRSLSFFLVALTSSIAIHKASEHFQTECERELSDSCHQSQIYTKVDDCQTFFYRKEEADEEAGRVIEWICCGECQPNGMWNYDVARFFSRKFGLHSEEVFKSKFPDKEESPLRLSEDDMFECQYYQLRHLFYFPAHYTSEMAKKEFHKVHLTPFCESNSKFLHHFKSERTIEFIIDYLDGIKNVDDSFCEAHDANIKARETHVFDYEKYNEMLYQQGLMPTAYDPLFCFSTSSVKMDEKDVEEFLKNVRKSTIV